MDTGGIEVEYILALIAGKVNPVVKLWVWIPGAIWHHPKFYYGVKLAFRFYLKTRATFTYQSLADRRRSAFSPKNPPFTPSRSRLDTKR